MLFNIINPSDPYTLEAVDIEIAAAAISLIGHGQYGLEQIGGERSANVPIFMMGGHDEWFTRQFGRDFATTLNHVTENRMPDLLKALSSVHIGTPQDKRLFDDAAKLCADQEEYMRLLHTHHDEKRSSMNDIGRRAWALADVLALQASMAPSGALAH